MIKQKLIGISGKDKRFKAQGKTIVILFGILFGLFLINFANAQVIYTGYANSNCIPPACGSNNTFGMVFITNTTVSNLTSIRKFPESNIPRVVIRASPTGGNLAEGIFVGTNATFNYLLSPNTVYYILGEREDGSTSVEQTYSAATFPYKGASGSIVSGFAGTANNSGVIWEFNSITFYGNPIQNIMVNLISPTNNSKIVSNLFNASWNGNVSFINSTLFLWHNNGTLIGTNFSNNNNKTNSSVLSIANIPIENNLIWNYKVYFNNISGTFYSFAPANYTFAYSNFVENSITYNATTYETTSETFILNLTQQNPNATTAANFWYNGIDKGIATVNKIGGNTILSNTIDVPFYNGLAETFYWNIITGGQNINSSINNQTINNITIGACSGSLTTLALNFTAYSEEDLTRLTPFNFYGTFFYWIGNGNIQKNFSVSSIGTNEQDICINNNLSYSANAIMQYEKTPGYIKRNYYFTNEPIINNSRSVNLYLLNTTDSTSFIINVQDINQFPISNAFVYIQRYYPGTNQFNTVEMGVTDNKGGTVGHFEAETEDYKIIIEKDNQFIYTGPTGKIYCSATPCTLNIQTAGGNQTQWVNFGSITNFTYSINFDNSTNIWTMTYADTSGHLGYGRFWVYYDDAIKGAVTICNLSSSNMSDILNCNVAGYNGTIYGAVYLSRSPEVFVYLKTIFTFGPNAIFGNEGLFLSLLVLLTLGLAGLWNPVVGVILVVVGMITLSLLGIASFGAVTLWGIIFIAALIIWELNN